LLPWLLLLLLLLLSSKVTKDSVCFRFNPHFLFLSLSLSLSLSLRISTVVLMSRSRSASIAAAVVAAGGPLAALRPHGDAAVAAAAAAAVLCEAFGLAGFRSAERPMDDGTAAAGDAEAVEAAAQRRREAALGEGQWMGDGKVLLAAVALRHPQSAMRFEVRLTLVGHSLLVAVAADAAPTAACTVELSLPLPFSAAAATAEANLGDAAAYADDAAIERWVLAVRAGIIAHVLPSLNKEGYEHDIAVPSGASSSSSSGSTSSAPRPAPSADPGADPLRIGPVRQPHGYPAYGRVPILPYGVGGHDLLPPPLADPRLPGGNLMGPRHPAFGRAPAGPVPPGMPYGAVPPGARFDPFGPMADPFANPPPGRPAARRPQPGEPDPDVDLPPGVDTMYL